MHTLQHPDWTVLDLDPKDAPFTDVIKIARAIHDLCDDMGLISFPKTSGSKGLHVLIPLDGQCTYQQSKGMAELISRIIAHELPDIATVNRSLDAREGRVYLDYIQNGHGRLLAAPWSVRPREKATVSTPLLWPEVTESLDPKAFTIVTLPERIERMGQDPLHTILTTKNDLKSALVKLTARL